jgi:hypothetical protein
MAEKEWPLEEDPTNNRPKKTADTTIPTNKERMSLVFLDIENNPYALHPRSILVE